MMALNQEINQNLGYGLGGVAHGHGHERQVLQAIHDAQGHGGGLEEYQAQVVALADSEAAVAESKVPQGMFFWIPFTIYRKIFLRHDNF